MPLGLLCYIAQSYWGTVVIYGKLSSAAGLWACYPLASPDSAEEPSILCEVPGQVYGTCI